MGLSNFPTPAEGVLPLLVMNTVMSVALLKNILRSVLQVVGAAGGEIEEECSGEDSGRSRARRVSITSYSLFCKNRGGDKFPVHECCVCLCGFKAEEEVSELSCKHYFHKGCLDRWFGDLHVTCPVCRSIM